MEGNEQLKELAAILSKWTEDAEKEVDNHSYTIGKSNFRCVTSSGNLKYKQTFLIPAPNDLTSLAANHATLYDVLHLVKSMAEDAEATPYKSFNSAQDILDLNFEGIDLNKRIRNN